MTQLAAFKAYDIRGRIPDEINVDLARRIGRAYVQIFGARKVVVGHDIRLTSPELALALSEGLMEGGADVFDIGECGTELVYFATAQYNMDGGIMVTASHNPIDYNGFKLVREGSRPISADSGLQEIRALVESGEFVPSERTGSLDMLDAWPDYIEHLMGYIEADQLKPLKIVSNPGNGGAGAVVDRLDPRLPCEFVRVHHEPDGHFPNGIPNPLLPENRGATREAVITHDADLGLAWDGDYDRCFFFDEEGGFIEGYYLVGLLAEAFLEKYPGATIIHDPRLIWNTIDIVERMGGRAVQSKCGHAFIKERMREEDAVYGGEMSAHHYFRDFFYCDSGMIPWLLVIELLSRRGKTLGEMVRERMAAFPCSGEINFRVSDVNAAIEDVRRYYLPGNPEVDETDGLSMSFGNWRFNLRGSNTEPVLRLNVESRGDADLMREKTEEVSSIIRPHVVN
ncbi:MAG: phosphomannomutase [Gammaproteobacteria bacterium]|nr:MAG: phosphomannomutase [Gammaproteobacteria bacterium]